MLRRFGLLLLAALSSALAIPDAEAIPAFARKYQISCSTCHAPFPRLKPLGEEFAGNGFRLPDPTQEPARATIEVGDPLLKLPRDFPIAARLEGYASYKEDAIAGSDTEFPWAFKVLSGGPIAKKISYYLYVILEKGEVVGLEDAWLQFNDGFGVPLDLLVGQFQVCDPMFKPATHRTACDGTVRAHPARAGRDELPVGGAVRRGRPPVPGAVPGAPRRSRRGGARDRHVGVRALPARVTPPGPEPHQPAETVTWHS